MADRRRGPNGLAIDFDGSALSRLQDREMAAALERLEKRLRSAYRAAVDDGLESLESLSWMLLWAPEEILRVKERAGSL